MPVLIILAVLIIVGGIYYVTTKRNSPVTASEVPVKSGSEVYRNNLLKYEVAIPIGWHLSEVMSKKMDVSLNIAQLSSSIGCDISNMAEKDLDVATRTRKFEDCLKNNKDYAKIEASNQEFQKNWNIGTAQSVCITKFTSKEETHFTLTDLSMPGDRLQKGSFILTSEDV